MARVTILMPVYNGERFLRETIENILCQTYTDFDFLIINDGSKDNSEEIILDYSDPRIIYYKNEKNLGLVATLNNGIEQVDTEFLARMDADDLWEKTKLEKQIKLLESQPNIGICGTSIRKFGAFNGDFIFPVDNDHLKVGFLFYCMMSHPSVVFRMSFLKESGLRYRSEFYPAEDYRIWVEALQLTQVFNIPEILVYYRVHEEQITQATNIKQLEKTREIRLIQLKRIYPQITPAEENFYQEIFADLNLNSITDYKTAGKFSKKIQLANRTTKCVTPDVLKKELSYYLQIGYKKYILKKYFNEKTLKSFLYYLWSLDWIYLNLRSNLKLFVQCVKKNKYAF